MTTAPLSTPYIMATFAPIAYYLNQPPNARPDSQFPSMWPVRITGRNSYPVSSSITALFLGLGKEPKPVILSPIPQFCHKQRQQNASLPPLASYNYLVAFPHQPPSYLGSDYGGPLKVLLLLSILAVLPFFSSFLFSILSSDRHGKPPCP